MRLQSLRTNYQPGTVRPKIVLAPGIRTSFLRTQTSDGPAVQSVSQPGVQLRRFAHPSLSGSLFHLGRGMHRFPTLLSRGLGGVVNMERAEMVRLAEAGVDLYSQTPRLLGWRGPLLLRQATEILGWGHLQEQKRRLMRFFLHEQDFGAAPRGLVFESFSSRYLVQGAKEGSAPMDRVARLGFLSPAFASSPHLGPLDRALHGLWPSRIMRHTRSMVPALDAALGARSTPLLVVVPTADHVVDPQAAIDVFGSLRGSYPRTLVILDGADHAVFSSKTPEKLRHAATAALSTFLTGGSREEIERAATSPGVEVRQA